MARIGESRSASFARLPLKSRGAVFGHFRACYNAFMRAETTDFEFLSGLDRDLRETALKQIKVLWTHTSTAIEGNTLSLGETQFVLEEGLTVSGKPIKDHEEVLGHGRAVDLVYSMLDRPVSEGDFHLVHEAVQTRVVTDIYKPTGAWKNEPNSTSAVDGDGRQAFIEYSMPEHVPILMKTIIDEMNLYSEGGVDPEVAHAVYAKIHIGIASVHPFWDGNGRVARLAANIPLLNSGLPPIVIPATERQEYIRSLSEYQIAVGTADTDTGPWNENVGYDRFTKFCAASYEASKEILLSAFKQQRRRDRKK